MSRAGADDSGSSYDSGSHSVGGHSSGVHHSGGGGRATDSSSSYSGNSYSFSGGSNSAQYEYTPKESNPCDDLIEAMKNNPILRNPEFYKRGCPPMTMGMGSPYTGNPYMQLYEARMFLYNLHNKYTWLKRFTIGICVIGFIFLIVTGR